MKTEEISKPEISSSLMQALDGRSLGISQSKITEALVGYTVLYRRFGRSLERAIKSVSEYEDRRCVEGYDQGTKGNSDSHILDFIESIYIAAEIFEFYEKYIPDLLLINRKMSPEYFREIRYLKNFSSNLCNKMKHEHAFPQSIEIEYEGGQFVSAFSIHKIENGTSKVVTDIHKDSPCFSFNWSFRKIICSILQADMASGQMVRSLSDKGGDKITSASFALPIMEAVVEISERSLLGVPNETRSPRIDYDHSERFFGIDRDDWRYPAGGSGKLRMYVDVIARSGGSEVPYLDGIVNFDLSSEGGVLQPSLPWFRIVLSDIGILDS